MAQLSRVEIRDIYAVNPDSRGYPRRLLVIGVADRPDRRLHVRFPEQNAWTAARFVDPARAFVHYVSPKFAADLFLPREAQRQAHVWIAEFDVGLYPELGQVTSGRQRVPMSVQALYLDDGDKESSSACRSFRKVPLVAGFDVGVLFVHGIGEQRTADTLTRWSTAIQKWINRWFDAASTRVAGLVHKPDVAGWEAGIGMRDDWMAYDLDYLARCELAGVLATKVKEQGPAVSNVEPAKYKQVSSETDPRPLTAEEHSVRARFIQHNEANVKASAVAGRAEFVTAHLLDSGGSMLDPANTELQIEALEADGYLRRSDWLLAESHWAETFRAPEPVAFTRWCLKAGPIAFSYYFGTLTRRSGRRFLFSVPKLIVLAAGVAVMEALLIALLVLAILPIPRLRVVLVKTQTRLTGVLGDAYVFSTDDLQRRAILERVRRDLRWMLARCRKVIVVAHSQGAAIAYHALHQTPEGRSPNLHSGVTIGSGLQTLRALAEFLTSAPIVATGWTAICGIVLLVAGAVLLGADRATAAIAVGTAGLLFLLLAGINAANRLGAEKFSIPYLGGLKPWLDFYAASDPVPLGPLIDDQNSQGLYRPAEIHNRDSLVTDHNSYWDNPEQFVGPLVRHIAGAAEYPPLMRLLPDDAEVMQLASSARVARLRWLRASRWVIALCTVLLLATQGSHLAGVIGWTSAKLAEKLAVGEATVDLPHGADWFLALVPFLPMVAYVVLIMPIWKIWSDAELTRVLCRNPAAAPPIWISLFVSTVVGVAHVAAYYSFGASATTLLYSWLILSALLAMLVFFAHGKRIETGAGIASNPHTARRQP